VATRQRWRYTFDLPAGDFRSHRAKVPYGFLPICTGADGRFTGGVRRHPGFKHVHTVSDVDSGIDFFKYAEVTKGTTRYRLRGFVVRDGTRLYFEYYDSEDGVWFVEDLDTASSGEIDITYGGQFLYVLPQGEQGSVFWWSTDDDEWKSGTLGYPTDPPAFAGDTSTKDNTNGGYYYSGDYNEISCTVAYRLGNSKRGMWGPLVTTTEIATATSLSLSADDRFYVTGNIELTADELEEYDTIQTFRTLDHGATLYPERYFYAPTETGDPDAVLGDCPGQNSPSGLPLRDKSSGADVYICFGRTDVPDSTDSALYIGGGLLDEGLVLNAAKAFNYTLQDASAVPQGGRGIYHSGVLYRTTEGTELTTETVGQVRFSRTDAFEPETFPVSNTHRASRTSDNIQRFILAGDAVYGIAEGRLIRFQRTGTTVTIQLTQHGWGFLNRWAVTAVNEQLAICTPTTLVLLNVSTGVASTVGAVERVLQDDAEWGTAKDNIRLAYDARSATLYLLNPDEEEMVLLWGTTNTVSRIADARFSYAVSGPDPETGGPDRAFFITPSGRVVTPNSDRDAERQTMTGLPSGSGFEVNGTFSEAISSDTLSPSQLGGWTAAPGDFSFGFDSGFSGGKNAPIEDTYVDSYLYVLKSDGTTARYRITASSSLTGLTLDETVSAASGDRWAIAPVVFEVAGWPLGADEDPQTPADLFRRRRIRTIGFVCDRLTDEWPVAPQMFVEVYEGIDTTPVACDVVTISDVSSENFSNVVAGGSLLLPAVKCYASDLDLELVAMLVKGTTEDTDSL